MNKLLQIQSRLKVKKSRFNTFGKFHFRNCEDILEAVKPLLEEIDGVLFFTEEINLVDKRTYIRSTATFRCDGEEYSCSSFAGLSFDRISDAAQAAGAATSYARKYALCGLFLIDDGVDNDSIIPAAPEITAAPVAPAAATLPPPPPGGRK